MVTLRRIGGSAFAGTGLAAEIILSSQGLCLTVSTAVIPWRSRTFFRLHRGLWHEGKLYRFATYTGAKPEHLAVTDEVVDWVLYSKTHRLHITAHRGADSQYGLLKLAHNGGNGQARA